MSKLRNIPTLPIFINKLMDIEPYDYSVKDIIKIIEMDQSISAKILKLSNSVFFGFSRKISSLNEAISLMGIDTIKAIALATSIFDINAFKGLDKNKIDIKKLWLHGSIASFLAKHIWERFNIKDFDSGTVFISTLCHDIGKLFLLLLYPEEYSNILLDADQEKKNTKYMEKKILGIDHATIASIIFDKWNYPHSLFIPVKFHHSLRDIPNAYHRISMIINASDKLAWNLGYGFAGSCEDDQDSLKEIGEKAIKDSILYLENNLDSIKDISDFIS